MLKWCLVASCAQACRSCIMRQTWSPDPTRSHTQETARIQQLCGMRRIQNAKKVHPHSANARKVCTDYLCTRTRTHSLAPDVAIHSSIRVRQRPRGAMAPPGSAKKTCTLAKLGIKPSTSLHPLALKPGTYDVESSAVTKTATRGPAVMGLGHTRTRRRHEEEECNPHPHPHSHRD